MVFHVFLGRNGINVEGATHKQVVDYIRSGGDTLTLTGMLHGYANILLCLSLFCTCLLLLLLRSPAISLGFTILDEMFACVTFFFFNPTIEVVTFCLRGWCMLGVVLLLAFTRLGHECQDILSLCDGMHVCTD